MRLQGEKEIQVVKRMRIGGEPYNTGDVIAVSEEDALYLIASGRAKSYPTLSEDEGDPEDKGRCREDAWKSGPYRVEITRPCLVQGFYCEPGEVISVDEEDAMCLAVSSRGRIIGRPPEEEDIEMKVVRLIEEKLRDAPVM